jgi:hypothetical protein
MDIVAVQCLSARNYEMLKYIYPRIDLDDRIELINLAAFIGNLDIFRYLLTYNDDLYEWYQSFLHSAILGKNYSVIRYLMDRIKPNRNNLMRCVIQGDVCLLELILNSMTVTNSMLIYMIEQAENIDVIKFLQAYEAKRLGN